MILTQWSHFVPTKLNLIAHGAPIFNIKSIFSGSQILTETQSLNLIKKFPNADIFLYYGASELSFVTYKKIYAENAAEINNLGKTFDGIKIFIRDGLIYIGDFGHFEGENLIFEGRGEDFINRGGVKLSALDIEQKLLKISGVKATAVVKIADEVRGDNFLAYIVGNIDKKTIRQALNPAESPKEIIFIKELPLNSSGKVDKKLLAAQTSQILQWRFRSATLSTSS